VYVLYDTNFRWLKHFSAKVSKGGPALLFLWAAFSKGLLLDRASTATRRLTAHAPPHTHTHITHTTDVLSNYVVFPCGVIRGALSSLGLASAVTAEFPSPPTCTWALPPLSALLCGWLMLVGVGWCDGDGDGDVTGVFTIRIKS
jgi:hypothetical protein